MHNWKNYKFIKYIIKISHFYIYVKIYDDMLWLIFYLKTTAVVFRSIRRACAIIEKTDFLHITCYGIAFIERLDGIHCGWPELVKFSSQW